MFSGLTSLPSRKQSPDDCPFFPLERNKDNGIWLPCLEEDEGLIYFLTLLEAVTYETIPIVDSIDFGGADVWKPDKTDRTRHLGPQRR